MSKNSLTTLLNDLLKLQVDAYTTTAKVSEIVSSSADTVVINLSDSDGAIKSVVVPSFGAIMDRLRKLDNDVQALAGVGSRSTSVRLADGKFRKVLTSSLKKEAADITAMSVPTTFNRKENWFFESFLSPLLYITFDLTGQIKSHTENVEVRRYILNLDTDAKTEVFNRTFKGAAEIQFQSFYETITDNEITFFSDEAVVPLPPRTVRYYGSFSVTDLFDDTLTEINDGVEYQRRVLRARLDSLQYSDRKSRFTRTQSLRVGDSLVVNQEPKNTRYEIVAVDASTRTVSLRLVEGHALIRIGVDTLEYYDEDEESVSVDINVGFNEHCVVFVRSIDPDSKVAAVNWSPGVGFYTNELTILDEADREVTLSQYYQNQVVDFGAYLFSAAKDKIPPSIFGVIPDPPALAEANLKVVQINEHVTANPAVDNLKKLQAEKTRISSVVSTLDKSVSALRTKTDTTRYSTKKLEDTDRSELARLVQERNSMSALFSSTVDDINKVATAQGVNDIAPKYRVRGFFPIPVPKSTDRTNPQEVVQFVTQYRYVKKDGSANQAEQIDFTDNDGNQRRGTFATWAEVRSAVRRRVTDPDTGIVSWDTEDVENSDAVNINQIDIPISPNEGIEIRVKSLSEAGWPASPKESVWSEIVRIDFPAELESIQGVSAITDEAKNDKARLAIRSELESLGVIRHVEGSVTQINQYFAHSAKEINSGYYTQEQSPIALFDKLRAMEEEITTVRSLVEKTRGKLVVKVTNDIGEEFTVERNKTLRIFAGNYRDEVANLPVKKGVIITKNYFVRVYNDTATVLELYAREFGSRLERITSSHTAGADYNSNDIDYNRVRRYDFVPLALSSPATADSDAYGFIRDYPEQSSQVLGQFINSRYKALDGKTSLYSNVLGDSYAVLNTTSVTLGVAPYTATVTEDLEYVAGATVLDALVTSAAIGATVDGDFIWKGGTNGFWVTPSTDSVVQSNLNDSIFVHIDHPLIGYWSSQFSTDTEVNDGVQDDVRNSIFGNLVFGATGFNRQSALFYEGVGGTADKYAKAGFVDTDQYLIGPLSVGAYLFPSPKSHEDICVTGADDLSYKQLRLGTREAVTLPVTFQYRMTDYAGVGTDGLGNIGGDPSAGSNRNMSYSKTLGFDVFFNPVDRDRFSFDLEVTARYFSKTLIGKDVPLRTFENSFDDFTNTLTTLSPRTSRDVG